MATKISYPDIGIKAYASNTTVLRSSKVQLNKNARFYASFSGPQRGGQHLGRRQRIDDVYLDLAEGCLRVGFIKKDRSGLSRRYITFCKLDVFKLEEEARI